MRLMLRIKNYFPRPGMVSKCVSFNCLVNSLFKDQAVICPPWLGPKDVRSRTCQNMRNPQQA